MTQTVSLQCDPTLNTARQALYRFTSLAFLDRRNGSAWEQLVNRQSQECVSAAAELIRNAPSMKPDDLGLGEQPIETLDMAAVFDRLPDSPEGLVAEYEHTFGLLVSGTCPPYETEFVNSKFTFQRSQQLADIAGFYRAFGMEPSSDHPERHDHIALELEFMAFLIGLEKQAAETRQLAGDDRVLICRDAQSRFVKDHLAWWIGAFAKLLAKEHPDGLHAAVAAVLAAFVPAERTLLGVEAPHKPATPSRMERPEECEGCLLQM